MRRMLIPGIALSLLFLSGSFFSALAVCQLNFNGCPPRSSSSLCSSTDADRDTMAGHESPWTSQGTFKYDTDKKAGLSNDFKQDKARNPSDAE